MKLNRLSVRLPIVLSFALVALSTRSFAAPWFPFGPDGGDARAFAADPRDHSHLYLGAANGWIYDSHDGGKTWKRLARVGNRDDLVIDNIVVDPAESKHVLVGTWVLGSSDGGLFASVDGGVTWSPNPEMKGESIRALTIAPSDGKIIVAGTLQGVFQSMDGGTHWKRISPAGSQEIHEVESIAIDPVNPQTIYAGTWHLPWKTTDGGEHWNNIKQGIIEDSDVFSIIVDPKQPNVVYASACSGIYRSDSAGTTFKKIQGIPSTARRTRVLMQDPSHPATVFAGTTEGLYRTDDSGTTWSRATGPEVIINDVYVDPANSKHVMLATDRGGVLTSNDGAVSFAGTNAGFSARQVTSFLADSQHPGELYVGVVNDKKAGGVFSSKDGGLTWTQRADGLEGRDVFSLGEAANGTLVAGTERGLYLYDQALQAWRKAGDLVPTPPAVEAPPPRRTAGKRGAHTAVAVQPQKARVVAKKPEVKRVEPGVTTIARVGDQLYAVTSEGAFATVDPSQPWKQVEGPEPEPWRYLANVQSTVLMSSLKHVTLSQDMGKTWHSIPMPPSLTQIGAVAVDQTGGLWIGGREGIFLSSDGGATWEGLKNLFVPDVNNIYLDQPAGRLLITSNGASTLVFSIHLPDRTVKAWDAGWNLRFVRPVGDYLLGATRFDGVVVQPRMVESKELASH